MKAHRGWLPIALFVLLIGGAIGLGVHLLTGSDESSDATSFDSKRIAEIAAAGGAGDPLAFDPSRRADFERRATLGYSHVLYEKSPGGILASAKRTAHWRGLIERAAAAHDTDPDLMEAMVLLESAGRPEVIAGDDPEVASGLAQIVASTGIDLLGMDIDLPRSQALTKGIARTGREIAKEQLKAASTKPKVRTPALLKLRMLSRRELALAKLRRRIDERFQPAAALDGMGTYLELAERRFGGAELATVSYHMGIGNLETAIGRYLETDAAGGKAAALVAANDLDYPRLFFDSSPLSHDRAWSLLSSLGDDSSTYLWRVLAAERIMALYRNDPGELRRLARLQTAKSTQEEVFHPESQTDVFADPDAIQSALDDGALVPLPTGTDVGYRIDKGMGQLAPNFGADQSLYRALRPEALATLIYMCAKVREINGGHGSLTVTSTVRDQGYQDQLVGINPEATSAYSLHTTGYSFDILRDYSGDSQAEAFQFVLDRLRALNVIDYAIEPDVIHITVSDEAEPLLAAG